MMLTDAMGARAVRVTRVICGTHVQHASAQCSAALDQTGFGACTTIRVNLGPAYDSPTQSSSAASVVVQECERLRLQSIAAHGMAPTDRHLPYPTLLWLSCIPSVSAARHQKGVRADVQCCCTCC